MGTKKPNIAMKRHLLLLLSVLGVSMLSAQDYAQFDSLTLKSQPILNLEKAKFLKDVNMIANTRYQFENNLLDGNVVDSRFTMPELRMEIMGQVSERLHFRIRDVYAFRSTDPRSRDRLRNSLDIAQIEFRASPEFSVAAGRMLPEWGAYEFEINPIFIYGFNHLVEYGDHFQNGVVVKWKPAPKHLLSFQAVNSRGASFQEIYGTVPGVEASKAPIGGTVNWRGTFLDGKLGTVYSYSIYNEAQDRNVTMLQLGNQLRLKKFVLQYDFKMSNDEIDRLGQVSNLIAAVQPVRAQNVQYVEHWVRTEYHITEKLSTTLIGMVATDNWLERPQGLPNVDVPREDKLRDSYSFTAALEYLVYKPQNLKLFVAYVGRYFNHTDYAKSQFGLTDFNTGQLMIGVVSPLVFF
jgi:hypothetical protein